VLNLSKTKIQINSIFGKLIFEHEAENNTILKTLLEAIKSSANLSFANLSSANLSSANLSSADLSYADLRFANLRFANLDYSAFPLSCGGLNVKIDKKIAIQLLYHALAQELDDPDYQLIRNNPKIIEFLKGFHRTEVKKYWEETTNA